MTSSDNIHDIWNKQSSPEIRSSQLEEVIMLAEKNTKKIKVKQFWTILILGFSILMFSSYSLLYVGFWFNWFHLGLSLMFFSLLLRLIVEFRSYISFRRIDIRTDLTNYTKSITEFYRKRKTVHYMITPIAASAYIIGFMLLLPVFKQSFSTGFFWYIIISGCILLILFLVLLTRQIKREMRLLNLVREVA